MALKPVTLEEMNALIAWIRNTVKAAHSKGVVVALSGGADSALVAALCTHALGPNSVLAINIPIESIDTAQSDAHKIAQWLEVRLFDRLLDVTFALFMKEIGLDNDPSYETLDEKKRTVLRGNVKARLRTTLARALAEANGFLFVNTCNCSETVVGYETKEGGDAGGDFAPLAQFVKADVWKMLRMLDAPQWIINKIPSADLEPNQSDENDIGITYEVLDTFASIVATDGPDAIIGLDTFQRELRVRFLELTENSAHKRLPRPVFQRAGFNFKN